MSQPSSSQPVLAAPAGSARGVLLLVLATLLWGSTVVIIKRINVPPSMINLVRFALATALLAPLARRDRRIWRAGIELSLWLFAAYASQAIGLKHTTVNRSAFITALNVIFVPIMSRLTGRKISPLVWASALTALLGCAMLCNDGKPPNIGDAWTLVTAITWAAYIVRVEKSAQSLPALPLAFAQIAPMVLMGMAWVAADHSMQSHLPWWALLYLGVPATAGTIWLQSAGQKTVPPAQTAVIFTLEPVFAAGFGYLVTGEMLGFQGLAGAALIVAAAITSQLPNLKVRKNSKVPLARE